MSFTFDYYRRFLSTDHIFTSDPYDIWCTKTGQLVKKIYYWNKLAGLLPSAVLLLFDSYINNEYRIGYSKREYPMVHAYKVLLAATLYQQKPHQDLLKEAKSSLSWLATNYSKGYSGYCWGANMPWVSKNGNYGETTPFITNTPYVLEALLEYSRIFGKTEFDYIIPTIFTFIEKDLVKIIDSSYELALSYSPQAERRIVLNANSYSLLCYSIFYSLYPDKAGYISDKILRIFNLLKRNQQNDGSWLYYADDLPGNFIDCFHSCFILKNLIKVNKVMYLDGSKEMIQLGYEFLKSNFYDQRKKLFKRFSKSDKTSIVQFDLYDNAEMLNLAILQQDQYLINILHSSINDKFVKGHDVYSQIIFYNKKINRNTLRWAVMPMLYAFVKSGL